MICKHTAPSTMEAPHATMLRTAGLTREAAWSLNRVLHTMPAVLMMSRREAGSTSFQNCGPIHFTHRSRLLIRMMLFALMGCALPCGAVNLGDATLLSGPAQPLRVEIELASEIQPGLQVRLASEQAFRENGIGYPAWLGNAQVSLLQAQGSRRRAALLLQAPQAAQAQLVELVLEFSWPTGSSQQPYVLLLDEASNSRQPAAPFSSPTPVVIAEVAEAPTAAQTQTETPEPIAGSVKPAPAIKPKAIPGTRTETAHPAVRKREHTGAISPRRPTPAARPAQDRLRLAKAKSDRADSIAQQRREADQQARMQELERNARQMRELADQVAAAAPPASPPQIAVSAAVPVSTAVAVPPASKAVSLPSKQPAHPGQLASIWLWVLAGLAMTLLVAWALRSWLARRRRPEFTDSVGAAGSVFELNPAEAERAYSDYMRRRPAPAQADTPNVEDARALFVVGHLAEAQQLLDTLIQQNPRSHEAWFLQARLLCAQGDSAGLAQRIIQLREVTGETGELWDRVLTLGHELDPGNPLYHSAVRQPDQPEPPAHPATSATQPAPPAIHKPPMPSSASSALDDALRMASTYGARPV
jgi:hypothetical protein